MKKLEEDIFDDGWYYHRYQSGEFVFTHRENGSVINSNGPYGISFYKDGTLRDVRWNDNYSFSGEREFVKLLGREYKIKEYIEFLQLIDNKQLCIDFEPEFHEVKYPEDLIKRLRMIPSLESILKNATQE